MENMIILKGEKVAVCGSVGPGKSILGEIPRIYARGVIVYGIKSLCPPECWDSNGTIRENVLFGKEMNKAFYDDILEACALNQDINIWQGRNLSVVGERGMNLSGGQKQRIQLVKAIYGDVDFFSLMTPSVLLMHLVAASPAKPEIDHQMN
nr:abc transporter c family member 5 [Quercus suber]